MGVIVAVAIIGCALGALVANSMPRRVSFWIWAAMAAVSGLLPLLGALTASSERPSELSGLGMTILLVGLVWPLSAGVVLGGLAAMAVARWRRRDL